jgi:hypothetical protein
MKPPQGSQENVHGLGRLMAQEAMEEACKAIASFMQRALDKIIELFRPTPNKPPLTNIGQAK